MDPGLYEAVASGDEATIFENFSRDTVLSIETREKNSVLHVAVVRKQLGMVNKILLLQSDHQCRPLLHLASRLGCQEIVAVILNRHRKNIETTTYYEDDVLTRFWKQLVDRERSSSSPKEITSMANLEMDTALHVAVKSGCLSVAELLIHEDAKLTLLTNGAGESPLFLAVERKCFDIARCLVDSDKKNSLAGRDGMNALHVAVVYSQQGWFYTQGTSFLN
ncbi:Transmembrane protein [Parasponia andersonii]|uniref:Transmembrane protein n=1 Tax=Parasponia andersonii TaxID=3476 RepID=A0A2P5D1P5_PARAD|nr:Transmembrane protein [Parasponia andersonii]